MAGAAGRPTGALTARAGGRSVVPYPKEVVVDDPRQHRLAWLERRREKQRLKRERTGDSPEKDAERHTPPEKVVDGMLRIGGVQRESRFKPDK